MPGVIRLQTEIPGPKSRALLARRAKAVPRGVPAVTPIAVVHAEGAVLTDADGNRLIDFGGGIGVVNTGHRHPGVVEAVRAQLDRFAHVCFPVSTYEPYVELAERLNRLTPGTHEKRTFFVNSGAEAVENAVKVARYFTGPAGGPLLRARLPRAHQPRHGAHLQGDALQEGLRAVRARGLPHSVSLLLPLRRGAARGRPVLHGRCRRGSSRSSPARWIPARSRPSSWSWSWARAGSCRRRWSTCRRSRRSPSSTASCSSPTRSRPGSAGPAGCSPASTTGWCPTS